MTDTVPPTHIVHRPCGHEEVLSAHLAWALAEQTLSELPCVFCSGSVRYPLAEFTEASHERIMSPETDGHPELVPAGPSPVGRPGGVGHKHRVRG